MNSQHDEIKKFDRLAEEFWKPDGEFSSLHQINPLRLKFIGDNADITGKRVLDVGCGGGILSESLDEKGAIVTAIDLSEGGIGAAKIRQQLSQSRVDYRVQSSTELLATLDEPFDVVCCLEMLEHVDDPQSIIDDCMKLVKPNGMVFFSTLNKTPKAKILAVWAAEYVLNMVPAGTHNHDQFITPTTLKNMAQSVGLTPVDIAGFTFQPLRRSFILSNDVSINYIMAFQKTHTDGETTLLSHQRTITPSSTHEKPTLGVLFDLDGTLVDSADDLTTALNQYLVEHNCAPLSKEQILSADVYGGKAFLRMGLNTEPSQAQIDDFIHVYADLGVHKTRPYANTQNILDELSEYHIPWGIVTNKDEAAALPVTTQFGYREQTSVIVYGNTLPLKKPHPDQLIMAADLLDITPEYCVYVGDSKSDITAAKNAGMQSIAVTYGYGKKADTWGADWVVDSVTALREKLSEITRV